VGLRQIYNDKFEIIFRGTGRPYKIVSYIWKMEQETDRVDEQDWPNLLCDMWLTEEMGGNHAPVTLQKIDISTAKTATVRPMTQ
jgi:hypothetical protein